MDEELRYGYTLDDLDHMTRTALMANRSMAADWIDRYDAAYFAITEHLYSAETWPQRHDLVGTGIKAISKMVRLELQHHGIDRQNMDNLAEGRKHRGYHMFWEGHLTFPSHEDYVVDRVALDQVWEVLSVGDRQIIAARAAYEDNGRAAEALARKRHSFVTQLNQGRRRFRTLWFGGETVRAWANDQAAPTEGSGTTSQRAMAYVRRRKREGSPEAGSRRSDRCKRGHIWDDYNTYWRRDGTRICRTCAADTRTRRAQAAAVKQEATSTHGYPRTRSATRAADRRASVAA